MARYQIPPDPREDDPTAPHAHRVAGGASRSSPPWLWIGLGAVVTILAIAVAVLWARLLLGPKPLEMKPSPTAVLRTAVPTPVPHEPAATETPLLVTLEPGPTTVPTSTQEPTPRPAGVMAIGVRVVVAGTAGAGVSLRAGPGTDYARLGVGSDGDVMQVLGGPEEGSGFTWWFVRAPDGTEAWVAEDFLTPPE